MADRSSELNAALVYSTAVGNFLWKLGFNRPKPTLLDALLAAAEAPPPFSSKLPSQGLK
jgi:hypothetical protein